MSKTGKLSIFNSISRVDGTLIIERTGDNPRTEATNDLQSRGFVNGDDPVTIIGANDFFEGEQAIDMTNAISGMGGEALKSAAARRQGAKKAGGAKKGAEKRTAAKKMGAEKKPSRKSTAKKSGGKSSGKKRR